MAKLLSKEDLIEKSKKYFGYHPSVTLFHATQDGQFFTEPGQARSHNEKVVKGEVVKIEKSVAFPPLVQDESDEDVEASFSEALEGAIDEIDSYDQDEAEADNGQNEAEQETEEVDQEEESPEDEMEALRNEYEKLSGERAGSRIKKETLIQRIEEHKKRAE